MAGQPDKHKDLTWGRGNSERERERESVLRTLKSWNQQNLVTD